MNTEYDIKKLVSNDDMTDETGKATKIKKD